MRLFISKNGAGPLIYDFFVRKKGGRGSNSEGESGNESGSGVNLDFRPRFHSKNMGHGGGGREETEKCSRSRTMDTILVFFLDDFSIVGETHSLRYFWVMEYYTKMAQQTKKVFVYYTSSFTVSNWKSGIFIPVIIFHSAQG